MLGARYIGNAVRLLCVGKIGNVNIFIYWKFLEKFYLFC